MYENFCREKKYLKRVNQYRTVGMSNFTFSSNKVMSFESVLTRPIQIISILDVLMEFLARSLTTISNALI